MRMGWRIHRREIQVHNNGRGGYILMKNSDWAQTGRGEVIMIVASRIGAEGPLCKEEEEPADAKGCAETKRKKYLV